LLLKVGGFRNRTITEDFDTTLAIIKTGYMVNYAPKAVAYTDAPAVHEIVNVFYPNRDEENSAPWYWSNFTCSKCNKELLLLEKHQHYA